MNEKLRTEAEKREIGWYFVIFSGNERPAYFDGKNWIVWGNMGFWNDSDLSKISDRLIADFHAQQSKERDMFTIGFHRWLKENCKRTMYLFEYRYKGVKYNDEQLLEIYKSTLT